jgi:hypothetical protein
MKRIRILIAAAVLLGVLGGCDSLPPAGQNACSGPPSVCNTDFGV